MPSKRDKHRTRTQERLRGREQEKWDRETDEQEQAGDFGRTMADETDEERWERLGLGGKKHRRRRKSRKKTKKSRKKRRKSRRKSRKKRKTKRRRRKR